MILVLLGTQNNSFSRLLNKIEECIDNKIINEEVVVQAGHTNFNSSKMKVLDFISQEELDNLISKARIIITHGGVGSIINSIKHGKKVIAVPRLMKYGEHVNDHQIQIIEKFSKEKYIVGIAELNELPSVLHSIDDFTPVKYNSGSSNIINIISDFINKF